MTRQTDAAARLFDSLLQELQNECERIAAINTTKDRERVLPELTIFIWLNKARAALASAAAEHESEAMRTDDGEDETTL